MKKTTKLVALLLAVIMVVSACGTQTDTTTPAATQAPVPAGSTAEPGPAPTDPATTPAAPAREVDNRLAAEVFGNAYDPADWNAESEALYEQILGDFLEAYAKVKTAKNLSERYAYQAAAEAIMYASAVFIPLTTNGGNYRLGRVVPKSINTTMWGNNEYRYHTVITTEELITAEDYNALKALWAEKAGTGTFSAEAKKFLTDKGYTLKDSYNYTYTGDPDTWDTLSSSRQIVGEPLAPTVDGLYQYNQENQLVPAIATSYTVSDDGLTYTFKLRNDVTWVDSQGRKVADLTADDFVAGMQHLLDSQSSPRGLLVGVIKGAEDYINGVTTNIEDVGVKAVDDYTVEYTLEQDVPYFMSMMAYNLFLPLNRSYFTSQGGKFGAEFDGTAADYTYGSDPDHIAYCGPMIVTAWTKNNTIVYKANESYYDPDALNVHTITWLYNDGQDKLKAYNDTKAGVVDACGLNSEAITTCKADGDMFEKYVSLSETDSTTFCGWINVNRKIYTNYNSTNCPSPKTVTQAEDTVAAMQNVHFRRALVAAFDHASYNAQRVGEELKLNALRNSYTPATFVSLSEEVTIDINGTATTFPAGTFYGQIMQAVLDANGVQIKVWDDEKASGDGFDGWFNPEYCKSELALAAADLAASGIPLSKENPIYVDYPYQSYDPVGQLIGNAVKQSIEEASDGMILVNLVETANRDEYRDTSYNTTYGYEQNTDFNTGSGWGPDYGDPQTYLATMVIDEDGYMLANLGMFGQ